MENATASFAYDALGRLSTAEERDGKRYAYEYDASGNRTSTTVRDRATNAVVETESYSYDARNRVDMYMDASGMPLSFSYDANGNITEDQNGGYTYDAFNRLTTHVEFQSGQYKETHYAYNGDGQRVSKTDAGNVSTYYQYDSDKVVLEQKSTGEVTRNTYGLNLISRSTGKVQEKSLNANMSVKVSYNETLYYQYNGHADVTRLSDANGIEKASYTYDAFGNVLESTGTENNPYRYAGYTYDEESSLYYLNARYYNPKTARFQATDPHWNSDNMIYGDNPRTINTIQNPIIEQSFVTAEIEPYVVDEELKVLRIKTKENVPEQGADQRIEQAEKQDGITVPDARAIIESGDLYVYCQNNPLVRIDPSGLASYIFYDENDDGFVNLEKAKQLQADLEAKYGTKCHLVPIGGGHTSEISGKELSAADYFIEKWNFMGRADDGEPLDAVVLYFHGPGGENIAGENIAGSGICFKSQGAGSEYKWDPRFKLGRVGELNVKTMDTLVLLGCESGNVISGKSNFATEMTNRMNAGYTIASDGDVYTRTNDGDFQVSTTLNYRGWKVYTKELDKDGKPTGKANATCIYWMGGKYIYRDLTTIIDDAKTKGDALKK